MRMTLMHGKWGDGSVKWAEGGERFALCVSTFAATGGGKKQYCGENSKLKGEGTKGPNLNGRSKRIVSEKIDKQTICTYYPKGAHGD